MDAPAPTVWSYRCAYFRQPLIALEGVEAWPWLPIDLASVEAANDGPSGPMAA